MDDLAARSAPFRIPSGPSSTAMVIASNRKHTPVVLAFLVALGVGTGCSPSREELQTSLDDANTKLSSEQQHSDSLQQQIAQLERDLKERDARIASLEAEGVASEADLAELRAEQERRRIELATFRDLFGRLENLISAGTVTVNFRKGRMNVELASAVLFDTAKTDLKPAGRAALDEIADAFASVAHRDLMIGGHTDNVPIKTRRYGSNWELSTQRAVVVVDYLIENGFPPDHLSAAGFGEYDPIQTNDTEEGRQFNRRIEIVLMPDLGELSGIKDMVPR